MGGVLRSVRKSQRMRWGRWRGRRLNYKKGWRSRQKLLIIESDDWAAEHIPGPEAVRQMERAGLGLPDLYYNYDGLEKPEDIDRLCEILSKYKDSKGKPAVITANFIMSNPDFDAVRQTDFRSFKAKPIDLGWNHEEDSEALWWSYRRAIQQGLIVPQLHGLWHFCPDEWLERLRRHDLASLKAFGLKMVGEKLISNGIGIQSMAPIYHTSQESIQRLVKEGIGIFKQIFNMDSLTTIAPCYAWKSPETEQALLSEGILAMQGKEYQYLPGGSIKPHFLGELGSGGMLYMVRTCRLEPISAGTSVDECFAQICDAFARNIPAVLCSHRINYTSRVDAKIRDKGLTVLDGVLKRVIQAYPNVEFLSSDKLALRILQKS